MRIDVLLPVLNEEKRLFQGVTETRNFLENQSDFTAYRITIVDNGSTDETETIAQDLCRRYEEVSYVRLAERGVGLAFRQGVAQTDYELVGYMDIDLSTDISHLHQVYQLFHDDSGLAFVTGSRNSVGSTVENRPLLRTITSKGLAWIINRCLATHYDDYMCGFKFFRRRPLQRLMQCASEEKGWFYCAELLIYGQWLGMNGQTLPVHWIDEREHSKVDQQMLALIRKYFREIWRMRKVGKKCGQL